MQKWWTSSWKRWLNSKHCVCGVGEEMGGGGDSGKTCGFCMMLLHEMKLMSFEVEKRWVFLVQAIKTGVVRVARIAPSMKIFGLKTIGRVICRGAKSKWHVQTTQETEPVLSNKYGGICRKLRVSNIHDHPRLNGKGGRLEPSHKRNKRFPHMTIGQAKQISLQMVVEHFWVPPTVLSTGSFTSTSVATRSCKCSHSLSRSYRCLSVDVHWNFSNRFEGSPASPEHGWNLEEQYDVHI